MLKKREVKIFFVSGLAIIFALIMVSSTVVEGQVDSFTEVQEKLIEISQEEREILSNLFLIVQEIEEMEREEEKISQDIVIINREIYDLEKIIAGKEVDYQKKQEDLKQVLKSYQRMGPGSYLEIILDSDSLTTFLRRINILKDLTRNTGELLEEMDENRERLTIEKTKLEEKLLLTEEKQYQLKEALAKKMQLRKDMEEYLASMEEEREYFQEHLASIQQVWQQLKPLLSETVEEFSRIIREGNLPPDALKISFSFAGIKGTLEEGTLNSIIAQHSSLPEMSFSFSDNKIEMRLPKQNLVLGGTFVIQGRDTLKFEVSEGSFYQMPLEAGALEDLFREGDLTLNLKPVLENNTLRSVDIKKGYIELLSTPFLF
ncbi:coiled-coil domain-containing protein [Natronincola peptidivorans]|nr:hypothetical protein [Natronincola peptidivorans]